MSKSNSQTPTLVIKSAKRNFYVTEILMLKSIIVLLVLTFFLLSEMQASNREIKVLKNSILYKTMEMPQITMSTDD